MIISLKIKEKIKEPIPYINGNITPNIFIIEKKLSSGKYKINKLVKI